MRISYAPLSHFPSLLIVKKGGYYYNLKNKLQKRKGG